MITIISLLESTAPGFSGFKRRDVGEGYGGVAGTLLGRLAGGVAGAGIGHMIDADSPGGGGPAAPLFGAAIGGALGGVPGALFGRRVGGNTISNPNANMDERSRLQRIGILAKAPTHPGLVAADSILPGSPGVIAGNMYNGMKVSDRLGYGTFGRFGAALGGPLLGGVFTPEKLDKKR